MDASGLATTLPDLIEMLPFLLNVTQWLFYVFLVFLCGAISLKGLRASLSSAAELAARLAAGAFCLFAGVSFAGFVPYWSSGIMHFLHMDVVVASLAASVAMLAALRLLTHGWRAAAAEQDAEALKRKVQRLEDKFAHGGRQIPEKEARSLAEKDVRGYKASAARLAGNEWEVELVSGGKRKKAFVDAWDGEIKAVSGGSGGADIVHPANIAGMAVIAALAVSSLLFFEGFPDPVGGFTEIFGLSPEDIGQLSEGLRDGLLSDVPEGCASPTIFTRYQASLADREFLLDHVYEDNSTMEMVEKDAGEKVNLMIRFEDGGDDIIMAFTEGGKGCYLTDGIFCGCVG